MRQRLYTLTLAVPVFVKVMGIALGMAVLLGAGMLWQIHRAWHAHLVRDLERHGQKIAAEVGERCVGLSRAGLTADIPTELRRSLAESPDVAYMIVENANGAVLTEARRNKNVPGGHMIRELTVAMGRGTGQLRVGMSTADLDNEVAWITRRLVGMTAAITLLGMLAAWWLTHLITRPIEELVKLARGVNAGQYQTKAPVRARDEIGELAEAFNEMTDTLAQKETARQQLLRKVISAGEEERKRIARELHDHTGQALTSQIAGLSALENKNRDATTRQRLAELRQQAEQTLTDVHDLSVTLRPSVLDDVGLVAALQRHCRTFGKRFGATVKFADIGMDGQRLSAEVELTVYRATQEALNNAVRHGQASHINVLVQRTPNGVLATIQDNGRGFDSHNWQKCCQEGDHLGLLGIEERVTLLGGSFCVDAKPGKGTTVYADIPLQDKS